MNTEQGFGLNLHQARISPINYFIAFALISSIFIGLMVGLAGQRMLELDIPVWTTLVFPLAGMTILLTGLLKYDLLVLITFSLIGFVRFEPAPFDLLIVVLLALGLVFGRLRLPPLSRGFLIQLGLWGLILTNLFSTLGVFSVSSSLRFLIITLYMLALFVFTRMYIVQPGAMRLVLIGCTVSACLNALPVMLSFLGLNLPFSVLAWSTRGVGFFKDSNVYGPFIVVAALWLLDLTMRPPYRLPRTGLLLLLAGLLTIASVLSLSRGAWVNLILAGLIYLGFLFRHAFRKAAGLLVFIAGFIGIALFVFQSFGLEDFVQNHFQLQGYDKVRFRIQSAGIIEGLSTPVGVGPGGWPNAHSLYVRTLAEQGVLGFISLGLLISGSLFPLVRHAWNRNEKDEVISAKMLTAMAVGQLVNSLVIDSIHWRHLWVILALAWSYQDLYGEKGK